MHIKHVILTGHKTDKKHAIITTGILLLLLLLLLLEVFLAGLFNTYLQVILLTD
jgi:hypothetical protein